jgi:hypothetical protein
MYSKFKTYIKFRRVSAQKRRWQKFYIQYELYFVKCIYWLTYNPKFIFTYSLKLDFYSLMRQKIFSNEVGDPL